MERLLFIIFFGICCVTVACLGHCNIGGMFIQNINENK